MAKQSKFSPWRYLVLGPLLAVVLTSCAGNQEPRTEVPIPDAGEPELARLIEAALQDDYAYDKLAELCEAVGSRLVGSAGMDRAMAWSAESFRTAGFDSVWREPVEAPYWTRGREWARCIGPVAFDLAISGLGQSDGTGPDGIEAEILAVRDMDELEARAAEADGRIVLFNPSWEGYGKAARHRVGGASAAARHGAVACLVRSATGHSLGAPHTGMMRYAEDAPRIPAAALTVEDADRLFRMCKRGLQPRVHLFMEAENHGMTTSYNVIGEIRGSRWPEQIILAGGHLDSWDVGTGAQDDGAGVVLTLAAARQLLQQGGRPSRTIRIVHFTSEELGGHGGRAYLETHRDELDRHVLALESDSGSYTPLGFSVDADSTTVARLAELARPLAWLSPGDWQVRRGGSGVDIGPIVREGVPGVGHRVEHSRYFDVHHSRADTFEKIDPEILARNVAVIAGLIHIVAEQPPGAPATGVAERFTNDSHPDGGH